MKEYSEYLNQINNVSELKEEVSWMRNLIMMNSSKANKLLDEKLDMAEKRLLLLDSCKCKS
jgi:hypothetical protein